MRRVEGWLSSRDLFDQRGGDAVVVVAVVGTPAWQDHFLSLTEKFGGIASKNPAPISACLARTGYIVQYSI